MRKTRLLVLLGTLLVLGLFLVGCEEDISASGLGEIEITITGNSTSDYYTFGWIYQEDSTTGLYEGSSTNTETPLITDDWLDDHGWKFSLDIFSPGTYDFTVYEHTLTPDGSDGYNDGSISRDISNVGNYSGIPIRI